MSSASYNALFRDQWGCVHVFLIDPHTSQYTVSPRPRCAQAFTIPYELQYGDILTITYQYPDPERKLDYTPVARTSVVTCLRCVCAR